MKKTRLMAFAVAFLIVVLLGLLILPGEGEKEIPVEKKEETVSVIQAAADIPAFTILTEKMLVSAEKPKSAVHEKDVLLPENAVGKRTLVEIVAGETLMSNHILDPDDPENRLAYLLEDGMRAVSVPVDDSTGVCNQLRAGDRVDVLITAASVAPEVVPTEEGQQRLDLRYKENNDVVGIMHLQDILVMALDQDTVYAPRVDSGLYDYRCVTLAVTPEDAVRLIWAETSAKITLALRAENDHGVITEIPYGAVDALYRTEEGVNG